MQPDYEKIMAALHDGQISELERISRVVTHFPNGRDEFLGRHWITNAIDYGSFDAVVWMLKQGEALDFCDDEGFTVLHACIDRRASPDKYEILQRLIAEGADIDAFGTNGWTPLHMAGAYGDLRALEILLKAGADRTIKTEIDNYATPAEEAKCLGQHEAAKFIENFK